MSDLTPAELAEQQDSNQIQRVPKTLAEAQEVWGAETDLYDIYGSAAIWLR